MNETDEVILKRLEAIERTLQQLPEVLSATFISMWHDYQVGLCQGKEPKDLWEITYPTNQR